MSHLRTCSLKIKDAKPGVLAEAVQLVAEEVGGKVGQTVSFYYEAGSIIPRLRGSEQIELTQEELDRVHKNAKQKVVASVIHPTLSPGGYGVNVSNGQIQVIGDDKFYNSEYSKPRQMPLQQFTDKVQQAYKVVAYQQQGEGGSGVFADQHILVASPLNGGTVALLGEGLFGFLQVQIFKSYIVHQISVSTKAEKCPICEGEGIIEPEKKPEPEKTELDAYLEANGIESTKKVEKPKPTPVTPAWIPWTPFRTTSWTTPTNAGTKWGKPWISCVGFYNGLNSASVSGSHRSSFQG